MGSYLAPMGLELTRLEKGATKGRYWGTCSQGLVGTFLDTSGLGFGRVRQDGGCCRGDVPPLPFGTQLTFAPWRCSNL